MIADKRTPLRKAKDLFDKGDPDSLRYCCLNLRDCIELICYERLEQYRRELPEEVFRSWRPRQIVELIAQCDPEATEDMTVRLRDTMPDGTLGGVGFEAEVKGVSKKVLRYYQKIGSYLHAPSLDVLLKGGKSDVSAQKSFLEETIQTIEEYVAKPMLINIGMFVNFKCVYCDALNVKNKKVLSEGSKITCTGKDCKASYIVRRLESGTPLFDPVQVEIQCACGARFFRGIHQLSYGATVECSDCKERFDITYRLTVSSKASPSLPGISEDNPL